MPSSHHSIATTDVVAYKIHENLFRLYFAEDVIAFTKELEDVKVTKLPKTVIFTCELNKPSTQVTWYKNEQPLRRSQRMDIEAEGRVHRLTIKDISDADEADYSAVVKNIKTAARLTVQSKNKNFSNFMMNLNTIVWFDAIIIMVRIV